VSESEWREFAYSCLFWRFTPYVPEYSKVDTINQLGFNEKCSRGNESMKCSCQRGAGQNHDNLSRNVDTSRV